MILTKSYRRGMVVNMSSSYIIAPWIGALSVYPIDVIKNRKQIYDTSYRCIIKDIYNSSGRIRLLYRGALLRTGLTSVEKSIKFITYDQMRVRFSPFISGAIAGAVQSLVMCPIENRSIQMQRGYKPGWNDIKSGRYKMYRGWVACLERDVLFSAVFFSLYEKRCEYKNVLSTFVASSVSGAIAAYLATPCDAVKTLKQTTMVNRNYWCIIDYIYDTRGVSGFFYGGGMRALRSGIQFGMTMAALNVLNLYNSV